MIYNVFVVFYNNKYIYDFSDFLLPQIGYEPADLTVHPPPRTAQGGFIFFV